MEKIVIGQQGAGYYADTEHIVIDIGAGTDYPQAVVFDFVRQIDDLLIQTPDGDLLMSWDLDHDQQEFDESKCMLLKAFDNMKEIGNLKTTLLAIRPKDTTQTLRVYLTAQRN